MSIDDTTDTCDDDVDSLVSVIHTVSYKSIKEEYYGNNIKLYKNDEIRIEKEEHQCYIGNVKKLNLTFVLQIKLFLSINILGIHKWKSFD